MKSSLFFILSIVLFSAVGAFEARAQSSAVSTTIVINEVYGGAGCGAQGCSTYNRDFIELKNISANAVDVTGWSVQYASGTSANPTWNVTVLSGSIAAGGIYLVGEATGAAGTGVNALPTPNASGNIAMSATTGKVALVNVSTAITTGTLCPIPNATIIDFVGYGAQAAGVMCFEGASAAASPTTSTSVQRNGAGADTDNNGADFTLGAPTPQTSFVPSNSAKNLFDFDGDSKTDIAIFRPAPGEWWINRSSNNTGYALQFGAGTDEIVPADYTGDGKTDVAVWRSSTGEWFVLRSEDNSFYSFPFGSSGDVTAPGDFDGDGKADAAVYRPSTTTWYIRRSSDSGTTIQTFGTSGDVPAVADYDGDGKSDIAIFRPSLGEWWLLRSTAGLIAFQFGNSSDKPVQGDYTGDGKADVAIFRPSTATWFILRSEDSSFFATQFGASSDVPVPGDYDGDGKFDPAVFRPSDLTWYVQRTTAGILIQPFGAAGDLPIPNAYVP
jgi:putative transposon-encoded protein